MLTLYANITNITFQHYADTGIFRHIIMSEYCYVDISVVSTCMATYLREKTTACFHNIRRHCPGHITCDTPA